MVWPKHTGWWTALVAALFLTGVSVAYEKAFVSDAMAVAASIIAFVLVRKARIEPGVARVERGRQGRRRAWFLVLSTSAWLPIVAANHWTLGVWPFYKPVPTQSIRVKFSDTQTIGTSNAPTDYGNTLNLDNVALLGTPGWGAGHATLNKIEMFLMKSPPTYVSDPANTMRFQSPSRELLVKVPSGWKVRDLRMFDTSGPKFIFTNSSPSHRITVGDRIFVVTLQFISDKSKPDERLTLFVYTFGISEE